MKKWFCFMFLLLVSPLMAQSTPTPTPLLAGKWVAAKVPWDLWFKDNATATDKCEYVHFFWNANDFKANFELKDKNRRLSDAAVYLVKKNYPADSKADLMKVDIVYVLQRDDYGLPKWDSMQQVAHFEFLRSKLIVGKKLPDFTVKSPEKVFDKFEVF
jgi:hypothetical protein